MTALFDRYISTLPELDRRAAGIAGESPARPPRTPRPRKFWRRARLTLAVILFALVQVVLTVAIVLGPVWSW